MNQLHALGSADSGFIDLEKNEEKDGDIHNRYRWMFQGQLWSLVFSSSLWQSF